jgi:hypothetical protein
MKINVIARVPDVGTKSLTSSEPLVMTIEFGMGCPWCEARLKHYIRSNFADQHQQLLSSC